jgi:hypothetical protein
VRREKENAMLESDTVTRLELSSAERDLLSKVLVAYISELRHAIAATKRSTRALHAEESLLKGLQARVAEAQ